MEVNNKQPGSIYPFLDKRTPKRNSPLFPVKLSVNLKGLQFRVGLKLYATEETFSKAMSGSGTIPKAAKQLKEQIEAYLQKGRQILNNFPNADREQFINLFKSESNLKVNDKTNLEVLFQLKIDELAKEDRAGSKSFYEQSLIALKAYRKNLFLEDITVQFLKNFRAWYIGQGNSNATAQIYLRSLRHIYNRAIKAGYISAGHYPFNEFTIGTVSRSKDVVYPEQIKLIWEYQPKNNGEKKAKAYFFFLYLSNGMNVKDALGLKGKNIKGNMVSFVRAKTSRTMKETKEVSFYLHPFALQVINEYGSLDANDYIFPCFRGLQTDIQRKKAKDIFARNINRDLRKIGITLGFTVNLTLNLARHSFATRLKLDGIPTSFITEALGHGNSSTTEHYLKTLPDNKYKIISDSLLNF